MTHRRATGTLVLREGTVAEATDGFAALYGRPGPELVGRAAEELLVPEDRPRVADLRARARRGELVPEMVEVALLLPGGGRRPVEWHTDREGDEEIVHVRDLGEDTARRKLVATLAEIGANLRAERSVESVFERLRDELGRLGAVSALIRAVDDRSSIVWSASPEELQREFAALAGRRAEGFSGPMSDFARRVLAEGCAFVDDWASHAPRYLPGVAPAAARNLVARAGFSRTIGVRIDAPGEDRLYLAIASPVLRSDDVPAVRLFGAQVSAALDAAKTIADLSRRNAHLAVLARVAELAGQVTDLPAFLQRASEIVRPVAGSLGGAIYVVDPVDGDLVRVQLDDGAPPVVEPLTRRFPADGLLGRVLRQMTPVVLPFPYDGAPPGLVLPFRAMAVVPLVARARGVGVQVVGFEEGVEAAQGALELLSSVGAHYASAIESQGLLGDLRARVGELEAVHALTLRVFANAPGDVPALLQDACGELVRALGAQAAAVYLSPDDGATLRAAASVGVPPEVLEVPLGLVDTMSSTVMRERVAIQNPDVTGDARSQLAGRSDLPSFAVLGVPLVSRHAVRGVVYVGDRPGRRFGPREITVAKALAGALGVGLENAELYADARRRAEELGLLHEVGRSLVHTLELEQVLSGGIRSLARIVDAPAAYLALATPDGTALELRAWEGTADPDARVGRRMPLAQPGRSDPAPGGPPVAALVYQLREPILIEDAESDPRVSPAARRLTGARAYLGLPLVVHDRCIGTVVIVETRGPRTFTPAEVERGAAIANQLAVAAENARLYEDLRRSYAELARAQQQVVQGERLAALGEMSAVVAHEVRNPLGVIFNSLGSLRRLVRPVGDARMLFEILEEEAERLNRIVGDLLDFARPSSPEVRPELLGRVAEDAVTAAVQPATGGVQVVRELDPDLPPVAMDARLVRQAILNVAVNAVQAMPRGGRLSVRTRREGDRAVVELEDTGAGIPEEVRERIFEPFFTTKASGTGLGLAVVRRIVEGHGGEVHVRSTPGTGTTFSLRFPLAPS